MSTWQWLRRLSMILALAWLGVSAVFAADEATTNAVTYSVAPPMASPLEALSKHAPYGSADHLQSIQNSFRQFLHWQYLLKLFLGFALAAIYASLLSWSPRGPAKADAAEGIEEGKTLVVLGMLGAVVAEVTKLSPTMAFVIFGIGSLVRFRTALDDPKLTGKAIMVVVIGLACGMDQWALGGFVTLAAWLLIYWLDSHVSVRLKISVGDKQDVRVVYDKVLEYFQSKRCRVKTANLYEVKRSMVFVAQIPSGLNASEVESMLHAQLGAADEDCEIKVHVY